MSIHISLDSLRQVLGTKTFLGTALAEAIMLPTDSEFVVVDGKTKEEISRNTAPNAVLQNLINAGTYKHIHVLKGTYDFGKNTVGAEDVDSYVITGSGRGINSVIQDGGLWFHGVTKNASLITLRDLAFYNTDKTLTAIDLLRPDNVTLENLRIRGYNIGILIDVTNGGMDNVILNTYLHENNVGLKIVGEYSPALKVIGCRITDNTTNIQIGSDTQPAPWNVKFIGCDIEVGKIVLDGRGAYRDIRDISIVSSYFEAVTMDIYANPSVTLSLIDNYIETGNPLIINVHQGNVWLMLLNRHAKINVNVDSGATLIIHSIDFGYHQSVFGLGSDYVGTQIIKGTINGTLKILPRATLPYVTSLPSSADHEGTALFYYDGTNYYIAVWDGSTWRKVQLT